MIRSLKKHLYNLYRISKYARGNAKKYHTGNEKPARQKMREMIQWQRKESSFPLFYYAWGLHLNGSNPQDYMGTREYVRLKEKAEKELKAKAGVEEFSYEVITKDKFYAEAVLRSLGVPVVPNLGVISNGLVLYHDGSSAEIESLSSIGSDFLIKNILLESGADLMYCQPESGKINVNGKIISYKDLKEKIGSRKWVVQKKQEASPELKKINDTALNTTRIVTVLKNGEPEFLTGFQSFATTGAKTDSWHKGSVYVGIDINKQCLKKYGYYHPDVGSEGRVEKHPDSGVIFEGYPLPQLTEAIEMCLKAHRFYYFHFIIGWDVAFTNEGPKILEANEKPGMNAVQCVDGGMRKRMEQRNRNDLM